MAVLQVCISGTPLRGPICSTLEKAQKGQGEQRYMTHTIDQFPLKTTRPPCVATNSLRLWTSANVELPPPSSAATS